MLAVLGSTALVLTDWPVGWSVWVDHPLLAAVVAGLLVVIVTVAVVDSYLRSREARRWRSVGRIAAAEFSHVFDQAQLGLLGMLGFDVSRPRPAIETFLANSRDRAKELWHAPATYDVEEQLVRQRDPADRTDDTWLRERLAVMTHDDEWIRRAHETLVVMAQVQLEVISRWVSSFAMLNDETHLRRVEGALRLIENLRVIDRMLLYGDPDGASELWTSLLADYRGEANRWFLIYQPDPGGPDMGPRRNEALRDR